MRIRQLHSRSADESKLLYRSFSARAGNIGDESRQGKTSDAFGAPGGDFLCPFQRNAEMRDPGNRIALENIVRPHPRALKRAEQIQHRIDRIVHASQKHSLARYGDSGIDKLSACAGGFLRHFAGAVKLGVHPNLAAPSQPFCEISGDALGIDAWRTRAKTHDIHLLKRQS